MKRVLNNRLELLKTVVPGWYRIAYEGTGEEPATFHFNMANSEIPGINGEPIDYTPKQLFNSPFLQSNYWSGVIRVRKGDLGDLP